MSIDRYRTFVIAARCKTFFEAANELYITPATVSKHIAALEQELGVVLFIRKPQGVVLTEEGKKKLPLAQQLVKTYDAFVGHIDTSEEIQSLTVLAASPPSRHGLAEIVHGFSQYRPDIKLDIRETRGATSAVINGEGDLGFLSDRQLDASQLRWIVIRRSELGAVLPAHHVLAGCESISLRELQYDEFVMPTPEIGVLSGYINMCRECGFTPKINHYCYREDSILFYISCGEGVSFMSREMFDRFNYQDVVFVPLNEKYYSTGVLARPRNRVLPPTASVFWEYVKKNYTIKMN